MSKQTPLYEQHLAVKAKMVDFGGWSMPINYGSQLAEHHQVRQDAGIFDVSHMTIIDMKGGEVVDYLRRMLANDVAKIVEHPGKALYTCLLNDKAGVIDDLIVYAMSSDWFRVVVNAATREKDLAWFRSHLDNMTVDINEREDLAMIAVQGPNARAKADKIIGEELQLKPFNAKVSGELFVARTGYTGEDGYEIICPADKASQLWQDLITEGCQPCGLGARDTLRLEAGMNLYGSDMDETTSPLESGLSWTLDFSDEQRHFTGRDQLLKQKKSTVKNKLVGLLLEGKGVLRAHQDVIFENGGRGTITSGGFSPTMERSIAFARVPQDATESCSVAIRNKHIPAKVVKLPFVRQGKILIGS